MVPYIGGKKIHAKWITSYFPKFDDITYYSEPFSGAFWVGLELAKYRPDSKHLQLFYNDMNICMYNMFWVMSDLAKQNTLDYVFTKSLENMPKRSKNQFKACKQSIIRWMPTQIIPETTRNAMAIYYAYCMTNTFAGAKNIDIRSMQFYNMPEKYYHKQDALINRLRNPYYVEVLKRISCSHINAIDFINHLNNPVFTLNDCSKSFFYIDPPYYGFETYYEPNKTDEDLQLHVKLAESLNKLQAKFALSYYYFPGIEELYPKDKYIYIEKEVFKANSRAKDGTKSKGIELLICNYEPPITEDVLTVQQINKLFKFMEPVK